MPKKNIKMLAKEEIKEQAILRGMQTARLCRIHNSKHIQSSRKFCKTKAEPSSQKMALEVQTDICFHSCIWLRFTLGFGLEQHPQLRSVKCIHLRGAAILFCLTTGIMSLF